MIKPMTSAEESELTSILASAFDAQTAQKLIAGIKKCESDGPIEAAFTSILRWIDEKGITGDDKTYLETYITKYPLDPDDFIFTTE
jgi:hypothetical protein